MARRQLQDLRAVVTGASSGIGREIAKELARAGAKLVITARRARVLQLLAVELRDAGAPTYAIDGDITSPTVREEALEAAHQHFGGLDLLINNAGVGAIGDFAEAAQHRVRQIMEVNFFAPVELTRLALPMLREGKTPMIVNISSVLGHRAVPKKSEYCASKFALHGFSDAIRAELASEGIDVLLVSPSTTASDFFDNVLEDRAELPWRRWGAMQPHVVARKTIAAIRKGKHEIILTPGGKALVWLDRMWPGVMNRLIGRLG